jgi:hypothetical protein
VRIGLYLDAVVADIQRRHSIFIFYARSSLFNLEAESEAMFVYDDQGG